MTLYSREWGQWQWQGERSGLKLKKSTKPAKIKLKVLNQHAGTSRHLRTLTKSNVFPLVSESVHSAWSDIFLGLSFLTKHCLAPCFCGKSGNMNEPYLWYPGPLSLNGLPLLLGCCWTSVSLLTCTHYGVLFWAPVSLVSWWDSCVSVRAKPSLGLAMSVWSSKVT